MDCPIYKLFEQNRCYGDQTKHENEFDVFITESYNMTDLLVHLRNFGDKNKSYIVVKYIGNIMQTRQLCIFNGSTYEKRNKTKTWNRYFYCNKKNDWKETNYRYNNEKITVKEMLNQIMD